MRLADPREERLQDIITTLSPLLASLVLSSIPTNAKVACEILKIYVGESLKQEDHKASLGYRSYKKRMRETNITLGDLSLCV